MVIIFINCKEQPFISRIIDGEKEYETRTRNMLGRFLGERVLLAETGNGNPVVRCEATIDSVISVHVPEYWEHYRSRAGVDRNSRYDWQPDTRIKWLYHLTDVKPIAPFVPAKSRRHGRTWMECDT